MVGLAGALVLNIGTLSASWVEAMLIAGAAANERGVPVVLDPVGAGATNYRTETAKRLLGEVDVTVLRGNAGEVATLVGVEAEVRGVESVGAGGDPAALARKAARTLGLVASVTGAVDHVSDGERAAAVSNGHELLASITGTGCMSTAITGCFLAGKGDPFEAAVEALLAFGVAGEDAGRGERARSFHVGAVRRSGRARLGNPVRAGEGRVLVRLHALVADEETALDACAGGATVVQLRLKGAPTAEVVALGRALEGLEAELIVNDDVDAAIELGTGIHLGQSDPGPSGARRGSDRSGDHAPGGRGRGVRGRGLPRRRPCVEDAVEADAAEPIDTACAMSASGPIGHRDRRVDPSNAAECIRAGAAGVAVISGVADRGVAAISSMNSLTPASSGCCQLESRGADRGAEHAPPSSREGWS